VTKVLVEQLSMGLARLFNLDLPWLFKGARSYTYRSTPRTRPAPGEYQQDSKPTGLLLLGHDRGENCAVPRKQRRSPVFEPESFCERNARLVPLYRKV